MIKLFFFKFILVIIFISSFGVYFFYKKGEIFHNDSNTTIQTFTKNLGTFTINIVDFKGDDRYIKFNIIMTFSGEIYESSFRKYSEQIIYKIKNHIINKYSEKILNKGFFDNQKLKDEIVIIINSNLNMNMIFEEEKRSSLVKGIEFKNIERR